MVQILQDEPSFASRFMKSNLDTAGAFGKAFLEEHVAKKQEEKEASEFERQFGKRMPKSARDEFYKSFGKEYGKSAVGGSGGREAENKFVKDEYGIDVSGISDDATRRAAIASGVKGNEKRKEKEESLSGIKDSLEWLEKNIHFSGKPGLHPKWGGVEAQGTSGGLGVANPETGKQMSNMELQAKREEIDRTGIWMADAIYTHFNKGVLNKEKWEDVKNQFATKADLPPSVNRARMAAAKRIMGLPSNMSSQAVDKVINSELKSLDKIEKAKGVSSENAKPLTTEIIDFFLKEANNDTKKAEDLAREAGYTW